MRLALASVTVALVALLGLGAAAAPASAHASLVSTDPAEGAVLPESPAAVSLTFNETISLAPDGLRVYDADGQPVEIEASAAGPEVSGELAPDLADGTYVVTWRVVSADGHPVAGSLTFHVGAPSERVVAPQDGGSATGEDELRPIVSIVQAVDYVTLLLAGGLAVFLGWFAQGVQVPDRVRRRVVRLVRASAAIAVVAAGIQVLLAGAYVRGAGLGDVLDLGAFDPGLVRDQITVLLLQMVGMGAAVLRTTRPHGTPSLAVDLLVALGVWSPALVGHTRAYEPSQLLVLTDVLHLSAGAVWLGGVVGLVLVLPSLAGRPKDAARVLTRFSATGAVLLVVLSGSGVLLAWRIVGSWAALVEETWGRLLLVKVVIAAVVVAAAGWNRYRLVPRTTQEDGHDARRQAVLGVRRTVAAEASLLVVILAVSGFLTNQPPRGETPVTVAATSGTGVVVGTAGDLKVLVLLDPGPGRQRQILVQVQDSAGEPYDGYAAPRLSLSGPDVDLGNVPLSANGSGTYVADVTFPVLGEWEAQVSVRVDEFTNPVTVVAFDVV